MVIETRGEGIDKSLSDGLRFSRVPDQQCHYRGHVRGHPNSRAALSLCDGVVSRFATQRVTKRARVRVSLVVIVRYVASPVIISRYQVFGNG